MLNENAIKKIKSIIASNTNKDNIITEIKLINDFSECKTIGNTRDVKNIFLSYSYNAFVCLKDFTDKEAMIMLDEAPFEEKTKAFKKGDVFIADDDDEFYVYYCNVNIDDIQESINENNETKEPLQVVDIFECYQKVLDNCNNNKEVWEKVKEMIDFYFK